MGETRITLVGRDGSLDALSGGYLLPRLVRKVDPDACTDAGRLGVDEVDGAAVEVGHPAGDGQTETGAAATLGVGERAEPLEDPVPVGDRDSRTLVGDLQPPAGGRLLGGEPDEAPGRTVTGRVVEEVGDELREARGVGGDGEVVGDHPAYELHGTGAELGLGYGAAQEVAHGDLFEPVLHGRQSLTAALESVRASRGDSGK